MQEYPYSLPIWGAKATANGYSLPYSAGIGINYLGQESDLVIENLQVGFNGGPKYNLDEIVRIDELQVKVDEGLEKVEEAGIQVDDWWESLTPPEQLNPVNKAKYETANRAIDAAGNLLTSVDGALSDGESSTVQYSLEKRPKDNWNFVVGSQFQLNKHLMVRGEFGFLGSRQQFIGGLQHRFCL